MGSRIKRFAAAAVVALVLGAVPAGAFHEDDLPLIASQSGLGSGWRSFTVTTDGSKYAIDIGGTGLSGPAQTAGFFYRDDNTFLGGFAFTAFPGKDGVLVRVNPPAGDPVNVDTMTTPGENALGLGFTFNDPQSGQAPFVGTWKMALWWAGDGVFDWAFRANPGTTIDATDADTSAYLVLSSEFASIAHAQGYSSSIGGRASVQADHPLEVSDTLLGFYQMGLGSAGTISVTTPSGEQSCGLTPLAVPILTGGICVFSEMQGGARNGPGDYVFHTTSAGAGFAGPFDDVWFGGADARLP
ncbi:MAG: hypothetical protein ACRDJM_00175 [Actinomycetota bacterium]